MERNPERDSMNRRKPIEQVQCNNLETKNEGLASADQRFFHDSSSNMNTNVGPPDYNLPVGARHVLNYSVQTGEEFVLAFMKERAIPRQHFLPNAYANCIATSYLNPPDNLGNNCSASESKEENPHVARMGEICSLVLERKNPSANKNGKFSEPVKTIAKSSSRTDICKGIQSYTSSRASDRSSTSVKFLCSFGGKILPRPSDGKLRFVGGETRLLQIKKEISWAVLMQKALEIYNQARIIKYQLPGEGLDALVSVCCDEDLQNMMEEFKVLEYGGSQKPRMFLFSNPSLEDAYISSMGDTEGDSEFQYLISVNGIGLTVKRNSTILASNSKTSRDKLLVLHNERATDTPIGETDKGTSSGLVPDVSSSTLQSSHPLLSNPPSAYDTNSQLYQKRNYKEASQHVFSQLVEIFPKIEESGNLQYLESEVQKCVPNMIDEADKIQSTKNQKISSLCPCDCSESNDIPRKQGSSFSPSADNKSPLLISCQCNYSLSNCIPKEQGSDVNPSEDDRSPLSLSTAKSINHQESSVPKGTVNGGEKTIILDHRLISSVTSTPKQNSSVKLAYKNFQAINDELAQLEIYKEISENINKKNADVSQVTDVGTCVVDSTDNQEVTKVGNNYADHSIESSCTTIQSQLVADPFSSCQSIGGADSNQDQFQKVRLTDSDDNETKTKKQPPPLVLKDEPACVMLPVVSSVAVGSTGQGDIPIDISERFPLDFFSDMFSKARVSGDILDLSPLQVNGTGLDLNMQNHEPMHSLYSRDLVQDEPVENNISLIDLDIKPLTNVEEKTSVDLSFPSLKTEGLQAGHPNSPFKVEENNPQMSSSIHGIRSNAMDLHSDCITAQLKVTGGTHVDKLNGSLNLESRVGKNTAGSLLNRSLGDIKISFLQIIRNEDLEELRELGSGTFGKVLHGKWRGTDVAIKRIKKNCFNGEMSEQERLTLEFWREAEILSKLHHPNVVAFYGAVQDGPGGTLAIVTEYMANGSLRHVLLCNDRHLDRRKRLIIAMDAAFGMEYLHSKNIVHFDLKCDNLLVDLRDPARPICKVNDFGMSKIKRDTMVTANIRGTLPWMAPELLNGSSSKVSEKVDVFSFGIVLWEILTGEEPYANLHFAEIIGGIVSNTLRPPVPSFCDPEWKRLMEQCWDPDPVARPSFTEIARRLRAMSAACQSKPPRSSRKEPGP